MINYKDMTKEEIIEFLQGEIEDEKRELLKNVKTCLNEANDKEYEEEGGHDEIIGYILVTLASATEEQDDGEKITGWLDAWRHSSAKDERGVFLGVLSNIKTIQGLEKLIGYLS